MILDSKCKTLINAGYSARQNKIVFYSHKDIIDNYEAQAQELKPIYSYIDTKTGVKDTRKGFLIWSLWEGCGVCHKDENGNYILTTGRQSDFFIND